jgi:hypothetical protein
MEGACVDRKEALHPRTNSGGCLMFCLSTPHATYTKIGQRQTYVFGDSQLTGSQTSTFQGTSGLGRICLLAMLVIWLKRAMQKDHKPIGEPLAKAALAAVLTGKEL